MIHRFNFAEPEKSNETSVIIQDVAPHTTYSLQVAAVINFTKYSQRSEPLLTTTFETGKIMEMDNFQY